MKILIVYATNSGGTYLAAERISDVLRESKHEAELLQAREIKPDRLLKYDLVIFGSPTWHIGGNQAMPQEYMMVLLEQMRKTNKAPRLYAAFGCGDKSFTIFCGAVDYIDTVLKSLGSKKIIPSLKIDGYYFHLLENQKIVDKWAKELLKALQ